MRQKMNRNLNLKSSFKSKTVSTYPSIQQHSMSLSPSFYFLAACIFIHPINLDRACVQLTNPNQLVFQSALAGRSHPRTMAMASNQATRPLCLSTSAAIHDFEHHCSVPYGHLPSAFSDDDASQPSSQYALESLCQMSRS